jgi:hypothetical protein
MYVCNPFMLGVPMPLKSRDTVFIQDGVCVHMYAYTHVCVHVRMYLFTVILLPTMSGDSVLFFEIVYVCEGLGHTMYTYAQVVCQSDAYIHSIGIHAFTYIHHTLALRLSSHQLSL